MHYHRYPDYDYSRGASLFVSLSTEPRRRLFGEVREGGVMALSPFGEEALQSIRYVFSSTPGISLFKLRSVEAEKLTPMVAKGPSLTLRLRLRTPQPLSQSPYARSLCLEEVSSRPPPYAIILL